MILKEKTWQNRFDFHGIFVCEFCGSEQKEERCYDDAYYHETVIPTKLRCRTCGETTVSGKEKSTNFVKREVVLSQKTLDLIQQLEQDYRFFELLGGRAKLFEEALQLYAFYYEEILKMKKKLYTGYTPGSAEEIKVVDGKYQIVREEEKDEIHDS